MILRNRFGNPAALVPAVIAFDNFTGANGSISGRALPAGGCSWTVDAGGCNILSNALAMILFGSPSVCSTTPGSPNANCSVSARMTVAGSGSAGLTIRQSTYGNSIQAIWPAAGVITLRKLVAAVPTTLATGTTAVNANDTVRVNASGDDISVYINGVLELTATESFNNTAQGVGLASTDLGWAFDDFLVTRP